MSFPGILIAIEGPECSGKTTAAKILAARLREEGREVITLFSHHDGEDGLAYAQRGLVLNPQLAATMSDTVRALCFAAARRSMLENTILPAMQEGKCVIVDRWVLSTLAIQRNASDLDAIIKLGTNDYVPDFTFVLDIPVELTVTRLASRNEQQDVLDLVPVEEHQARLDVYLRSDKYLDYLERSTHLDIPWVYKTINAQNQTPEEIVDSMFASIADKLDTYDFFTKA